jgi:tripartite-type tricarboxylate transporter receptor subunit TctC
MPASGNNAALITHDGLAAVKAHLMRRCAILFLALSGVWPGAVVAQQPVEDFYRGKKIDLIIGYSPGGTYDLYARLVARHLGNYIPGRPLIVPRNMPGAGSRAAATWVYNVAPRDGTVLAAVDQSLSLQQAAGDKRMNFDTTKFIYIGNPNSENNTTAAWHASGIRTIEDAKRREVTVGATGGSTSSQYPKAMNALLGTKFRIIIGYPGGNDINLAMERGEVEVRGSNSWASWKATRPQWLAEKKINILVQIGLKKAPDLPDVPLLMELGTNDDDRALLRLLSASTHIGRPIFTTPDVPSDRVKALRDAFDAMVRDPAFREQARRENFDIEPVPGEALQKLVSEVVAMPAAHSERLKKIIE